MPGLAVFIAWNQVATSAALLGVALVARAFKTQPALRLRAIGHPRDGADAREPACRFERYEDFSVSFDFDAGKAALGTFAKCRDPDGNTFVLSSRSATSEFFYRSRR
jgi:hypothetical protein